MFSDSESTGGSSESRSLDSESISPGIEILKSSNENSMKDQNVKIYKAALFYNELCHREYVHIYVQLKEK